MKVTIIYDNTSFRQDLQSDWGFSCLLDLDVLQPGSMRILFDTGADGRILLNNMEKLGIDPLSIDEVFISHPHFDHIGGLSEFLNKNNKVKVWVPPSLRGIKKAKEVITVKGPTELHKGIHSTGELEGIEQSLAVKTSRGIVIIVGCSHPYMGNILKAAKQFGELFGIIGGLHGFSEFELFKDLGLICPTHCTQHKTELKKLYPQKYVEGGAGKIIEI
jgi:7,8-dihydropterin-6-yl-methyl-4-(beta-D-ribofuranosyl)aminobenzene 5'-phosphate synthase